MTLRLLDLFWKKPAQGPVGIDRALAEVSLLDEVTRAFLNKDGTVTVWVREPVATCDEKIVRTLRRHVPDVRGVIQRVLTPPRLITTTSALWVN